MAIQMVLICEVLDARNFTASDLFSFLAYIIQSNLVFEIDFSIR